MKIIGITGKMGAGKDAVATAMGQADPSVRRIALADALKRTAMDLFDLSYDQVFGSQAQKAEMDPRWGKSPREILQTMGTDVARALHPDVWVRRMIRDMETWEHHHRAWVFDAANRRWEMAYFGLRTDSPQEHPIWVVPDVRFPNEAAAIRKAGGVVLKVTRPFEFATWGKNSDGAPWRQCKLCHAYYPPLFSYPPPDSAAWHRDTCPHAHPSERGVDEIEPDYTFINEIEGLEHVQRQAEHYLNRAKAERGW